MTSFDSLEDLVLPAIVWKLIAVGAVVVGAFIVYAIGRRVLNRLGQPKHDLDPALSGRSQTARGLLVSAWRYVVVVLALLALLSLVPGSLSRAVAVTGFAGLFLALAAQSLVKDVIAGFSILLEGQFGVGDRVHLFGPDIEGTVEGIGLRLTVLREDGGARVFVPNGAITAVRALAGHAAPGRAASEDRTRRGGRGRTRTRSRGRGQRGPDSGRPGAEASAAPEASAAAPAEEQRPPRANGPRSDRGPREPRPQAERPERAREPRQQPERPERAREPRQQPDRPERAREPRAPSDRPESGGDRPAPEPRPERQTQPAPETVPPKEGADRDRGESPKRGELEESPWSIE